MKHMCSSGYNKKLLLWYFMRATLHDNSAVFKTTDLKDKLLKSFITEMFNSLEFIGDTKKFSHFANLKVSHWK